MIDLYYGDWRDYKPPVHVNAIITDPPYDADPAEISKLWAGFEGAVIMFCRPENQFFIADEYAFWIKTPSTKNYSRHLGRFVEMILIRRAMTFNLLHWSQMTGVYDDRLIYPPIHPNEKPLALMERLIRIYTDPRDVVFDPFAGSGTTGVACIQTARSFIGCENNRQWYELARRRLGIIW